MRKMRPSSVVLSCSVSTPPGPRLRADWARLRSDRILKWTKDPHAHLQRCRVATRLDGTHKSRELDGTHKSRESDATLNRKSAIRNTNQQMLRVVVVSLSSIPGEVEAVSVEVKSGGLCLVSTGRKGKGKTGAVVFGAQCFLPLPVTEDLAFEVALFKPGESEVVGTAVLRKHVFMGDNATLEDVSRVLAVKVAGMPPMGLRVQIDSHGMFTDKREVSEASSTSLAVQYEQLLAMLAKKAANVSQQQSLQEDESSVIVKTRDAVMNESSTKYAVSGDACAGVVSNMVSSSIVFDGESATVVNVLLKLGQPVMYGTPLFEASLDGTGEAESEVKGGNEGYTSAAAAAVSYGEAGSLYDRPSSSIRSSRAESVSSRPVSVICNTRSEVGIVGKIFICRDKMVSKGDVLFEIEIDSEAVQRAHLIWADAALQSRSVDSVQNAESINARFQQYSQDLTAKLTSLTLDTAPYVLLTCNNLEKVARDFIETARTYGRVIISEMHLPMEAKTVRPISMGGVLGGHKYLVRGVLFKIPNGELFKGYPDPLHIANKIQGHELKGLSAYFGWFFNRGELSQVSFPLMAVIDFKGHRITAMTHLPIKGSQTLMYGSDDAGTECHVKQDDAAFSKCVFEASCGMNLAEHWVVNGRTKGGEARIASCVDLEGHQGLDGRKYLLDFSRTFPAMLKAEPLSYDQFWPFYNLFRQEAVRKWQKPLSADAFSNFQSTISVERRTEAKSWNQEAKNATRFVLTDCVMQVAKALLDDNGVSSHNRVFHKHGLNMRYIGLVYAQFVSSTLYLPKYKHVRAALLAEAMARVLKNLLRSELRRNASGTESQLLAVAASWLNVVFGQSESLRSWTKSNPLVSVGLIRDFSFNDSDALRCVMQFQTNNTLIAYPDGSGSVKELLPKYAVLRRLNESVGLGLSNSLLDSLGVEERGPFGRSFGHSLVFDDLDISFTENIDTVDVIERARGAKLFLLGCLAVEEGNSAAAQDHLLSAYQILSSALDANPSDNFLCSLFGDVCALLARLMEEAAEDEDAMKIASLFSERALQHLKLSADSDKGCYPAQKKLAICLMQNNKIDKAERLLLDILERFSSRACEDADVISSLLHVLEIRGDKTTAMKIRTLLEDVLVLHEEKESDKGGHDGEKLKSSGLLASKNLGKSIFQLGGNLARGAKKAIKRSESVSVDLNEPILISAFLLMTKEERGGKEDAPKRRWCTLTSSVLRFFDSENEAESRGTVAVHKLTIVGRRIRSEVKDQVRFFAAQEDATFDLWESHLRKLGVMEPVGAPSSKERSDTAAGAIFIGSKLHMPKILRRGHSVQDMAEDNSLHVRKKSDTAPVSPRVPSPNGPSPRGVSPPVSPRAGEIILPPEFSHMSHDGKSSFSKAAAKMFSRTKKSPRGEGETMSEIYSPGADDRADARSLAGVLNWKKTDSGIDLRDSGEIASRSMIEPGQCHSASELFDSSSDGDLLADLCRDTPSAKVGWERGKKHSDGLSTCGVSEPPVTSTAKRGFAFGRKKPHLTGRLSSISDDDSVTSPSRLSEGEMLDAKSRESDHDEDVPEAVVSQKSVNKKLMALLHRK
jgi:hypothetical protein